MDVYQDPSAGTQLDDMNPGIATNGLFWTVAIAQDNVEVNFGKSRAVMEVNDIRVRDYGTFNNSVFGGPSEPATLSFEVRWFGRRESQRVHNVAGQVSGEFVQDSAQMEWSATVGDLRFVSKPASTSSSAFAELTHERNGI